MEWDEAKSDKNRAERGFGFEIVHEFDWTSAVVVEDDRKDYGETRLMAFGKAGELQLAIVYTERAGGIRIISVRRMHEKEARRYGL